MGLGAYPSTDKQFLGMLGMHGTFEANTAMHESDLIWGLVFVLMIAQQII